MAKNTCITLKPDSQYLHNSLMILVWITKLKNAFRATSYSAIKFLWDLGLISSLFDIASSRDVRCLQPQELRSMHYLCPLYSVLFTDNARCRLVITRYGFPLVALTGYPSTCPYFLWQMNRLQSNTLCL